MASLLSLSTEIKFLIINYLDTDTCINPSVLSLSRTCRTFNILCAEVLHRHVVLRNNVQSGNEIGRIAKEPGFASRVRTLHFEGIKCMPTHPKLHPPSDMSKEPGPPCPEDLPQCVADIISQLYLFSRLEKTSIQFRFAQSEQKDDQAMEEGLDHFECSETDAIVLREESTIAWRSLMSCVYNQLLKNRPGSVKSLSLVRVPPKVVSTWKTPGWVEFLRGLDTFELSFRGCKHIKDCGVSGLYGLECLPFIVRETILSHLFNITRLRIAADSTWMMDVDSFNWCALGPFKQLLTLEVVGFFVDDDLEWFLSKHCSTLRTLRLVNCYSHSPQAGYDFISWAVFFNSLAEKVTSSRLTSVSLESYSAKTPSAIQRTLAEGRNARRTVTGTGSPPGLKVFPYGTYDPAAGRFRPDYKHTEDQLRGGLDQLTWDSLMSVVQANSTGSSN